MDILKLTLISHDGFYLANYFAPFCCQFLSILIQKNTSIWPLLIKICVFTMGELQRYLKHLHHDRHRDHRCYGRVDKKRRAGIERQNESTKVIFAEAV